MGLDTKLIFNFVVASVIVVLLTKFVFSKIPMLSYESDYEE